MRPTHPVQPPRRRPRPSPAYSDGSRAGTIAPPGPADPVPPPPHARVMTFRDGGPPPFPDGVGVTAPPTPSNLIAVSSVSGGIGCSVIAALLAGEFDCRQYSCALIDADFAAGGLDVLLGIENEPGTRFETLEAPLGRIDGEALKHELPRWNGVTVLAFDAWNADAPDWWEAQAAVRALCDANQLAVVDAGRGGAASTIPDLDAGIRLLVFEMSVLGLARTKARLASPRPAPHVLVGVSPRGGTRRQGMVEADEASEYLDMTVEFVMAQDRRMHDDVTGGLGVRASSGRNRRTVARLADRLWTMMRDGADAPRTDGDHDDA